MLGPRSVVQFVVAAPLGREPLAASSLHPGGANFAFGDGSVRFLKETITTWEYNPTTGYPLGIRFDADNGFYDVNRSVQFGVLQALSTRDGGEAVSRGDD